MPPKFMFGGGGLKCKTCTKTVYQNELQNYDGQAFHQECFKCLKCRNRLTVSGVAMISGDLYCKPCFSKIFKEKGSYGSFGAKTLPKAQQQEAKSQESAATQEPVSVPTPAPAPAPAVAEAEVSEPEVSEPEVSEPGAAEVEAPVEVQAQG